MLALDCAATEFFKGGKYEISGEDLSLSPHEMADYLGKLERAISKLGLSGVLVNSHILGEYLDNPKFNEVLEAIEAMDG